jgi:hypothetical protein
VGEEKSTQLLELQLDRKLLTLLANLYFEQAVEGMPGAETVQKWTNKSQVELQSTSPFCAPADLGHPNRRLTWLFFCSLFFFYS